MNEEQRPRDALLEEVEQKHLLAALARPPQPAWPPPGARPTIHYTELPEAKADNESARNWNFYRREVGRLLAEGHEGKWLLIHDERIVGMWDTADEVERVRVERFLMRTILIHQIRERDPVYRCGALFRRCRS
jgi:hypothetical protein